VSVGPSSLSRISFQGSVDGSITLLEMESETSLPDGVHAIDSVDVDVPWEANSMSATLEFTFSESELNVSRYEDVSVYRRGGASPARLDANVSQRGEQVVVRAETDEFSTLWSRFVVAGELTEEAKAQAAVTSATPDSTADEPEAGQETAAPVVEGDAQPAREDDANADSDPVPAAATGPEGDASDQPTAAAQPTANATTTPTAANGTSPTSTPADGPGLGSLGALLALVLTLGLRRRS
jgi:pyruvate/2-oxoglutarate dehydrogenase complex dihydrolipoamide acyltransferase (E2) component